MTEGNIGTDDIASSITVIDSKVPWFPISACTCLEFLIDGSKTIQARLPGKRFAVGRLQLQPAGIMSLDNHQHLFCGYDLRLQRLDV